MGRTKKFNTDDEIKAEIERLQTELKAITDAKEKIKIQAKICYWKKHNQKLENRHDQYIKSKKKSATEHIEKHVQKIQEWTKLLQS